MPTVRPRVAVAVSTHERAGRLERMLEALRRQTLDKAEFEVVVFDDGSRDGTRAVLDAEAARGELNLVAIHGDSPAGPATGREEAWRAASAAVIAFTDDDCEPAPAWLEEGMAALERNPGGFIQGRTEPNPGEADRLGPFTRTIEVTSADPNFHTCNIFYPRELLERIGGFDTDSFGRSPGGEDADLAWRAIGAGAPPEFADAALVHHAVNELGPAGKLRVAARWSTPMKAYAMHPELRRRVFTHGIFWKREHYWLARALLAAVLPRRWAALRLALALPYLRSLPARGREHGRPLSLVPYFLAHDLVELITVARGAVRYRTPML
jgi:GT2 family glycosyltransferase